MEESTNSRWALVIRDNGEARVMPLANTDMSVIDQDTSEEDKKSPLMLPAENQNEALKVRSSVPTLGEYSPNDKMKILKEKSVAEPEKNSPCISLSANHLEDFADHLGGKIITLTDIGHSLDSTDITSIEKTTIDSTDLQNCTPITMKIENCKEILVCDDDLPAHVIRTRVKGNTFVSSVRDNFGNTRATDGDEGGGTLRISSNSVSSRNTLGEKQSKEREEYFHQVQNWTKKLPARFSNGLYEPFEKVEATLNQDVITELGIGTEKGIFLNLHRQGTAKGVRVMETGPNQVVVSGSLVELLASRDLILKEINRIKGCVEEAKPLETEEQSLTREVGVMCELIPSPPMTRPSSSLEMASTNNSQFHPLGSLASPPHLQRRSSRRQRVQNPKRSNFEQTKVPSDFSGRCKVQLTKPEPIKNPNQDHFDKTENSAKESSHGVDYLKVDTVIKTSVKGSPVKELDFNQTSVLNNQKQQFDLIDKCDSMVSEDSSKFFEQCDGDYVLSSFQTDVSPEIPEVRSDDVKQCNKEVQLNNKENMLIDLERIESKMGEENDILERAIKQACNLVENGTDVISEVKISEASRGTTSKEANYKFSCDICSYKSMRENHFVKHMKLHEKGLALYQCNECSFVSIRSGHLRRHKMSHSIQVIKCHLCTYVCDDKKYLVKHIRVKHSDPKKPQEQESRQVFECHDCAYKTTRKYSFERHRRCHSSTKMMVFHNCPDCLYKTSRREHFLRHVKNVHQNHRPFLCDICGKAFKRQDALKQHHVTHYQNVGTKNSGVICHICQKVCRSSAYLKDHMATHSEVRSFLCEICGASFKTRSVQRNHVQTIHRRPRAFTCLTCSKKFNTKFALHRHMKQHDLIVEEEEGLQDMKVMGTCALSTFQQSFESVNKLDHSSTSASIKSMEASLSTQVPPTSTYQMTIDDQPEFILPDLNPPLASLEEPKTIIGDSTHLVKEVAIGSSTIQSLGGGANQSSPLVVDSATVNMIDKGPIVQTAGNLVSPRQFESTGNAKASGGGFTAYVTSEHTNQTLLYLTANFD